MDDQINKVEILPPDLAIVTFNFRMIETVNLILITILGINEYRSIITWLGSVIKILKSPRKSNRK